MPTIIIPPKPSPQPTIERLAVSQREAAAMLSISERTLRNWTKQGKVRVKKAGSRLLYPLAFLQDFLQDSETAGDTQTE